MASSMGSNVSVGRGAPVGGIQPVKQKAFQTKRHQPSKRRKGKKKREEKSPDQLADSRKSKDQKDDPKARKRRKKGSKASGSLLDVIV
jgi:hypothetical protein